MKTLLHHVAIASGLVLGIVPATSSLRAATPPANEPLRVCADSNYMPYSGRDGEGFENKVAAVVAQALGRKLEYHWASYRGQGGFSNFLGEDLDAGKCDVVMDLPYGDVEEGYTEPYYTSSYVFVTKNSAPYDITSMNSPVLRTIKIGIETDTPPEDVLKILGLTSNIVPFDVAGNPQESPKSMLQAVQDGKVGVLITWQPAIGYFLKTYPDLKTTAVPSEQYAPGIPAARFSFAMAMGVRKNDTVLKHELDKAVSSQKDQINAILAAYNVPRQPSAAVNYPGQ
jgi:mxaJ protein